MKYSKVIYLGGAPMTGKTTIARIIASHLGYSCISTDDIGAGITAVTNVSSHPAFHYMNNLDYREYYIVRSIEDLILDINNQHDALWPALSTLFHNHSSWDVETVIEGWALRPSYVSQLSGDISGLFLIANDLLLKSRIQKTDFSHGSSNPEVMSQKYLERSLWFNQQLRNQVSQLGLKSVSVSIDSQLDEIVDKCLNLLFSA